MISTLGQLSHLIQLLRTAPASLFIRLFQVRTRHWNLCLTSYRGHMSSPAKNSPYILLRTFLGLRSPLTWLGVERKKILPVPIPRLTNLSSDIDIIFSLISFLASLTCRQEMGNRSHLVWVQNWFGTTL